MQGVIVNEPPPTVQPNWQVLFVTVMVEVGGNGFIAIILESVVLPQGVLPTAVSVMVTVPLLLSFVPGIYIGVNELLSLGEKVPSPFVVQVKLALLVTEEPATT